MRLAPAGNVRPKLVATVVAASSALVVPPEAATTACTNVVSGLMVVEPAGALRATVLGAPVSTFTPPVAMMVPVGAPAGMKKLPLASVVPSAKSMSGSTSPLPSTSM